MRHPVPPPQAPQFLQNPPTVTFQVTEQVIQIRPQNLNEMRFCLGVRAEETKNKFR